MAEDVLAGSSPAASADSATPASSTPASVSVTPASESSAAPASSTPASTEPGPVPYGRFKEVNDQLKAAREYQSKYEWAEQFHQDPYTFVDAWIDQLAAKPQYQAQILAKAARLLNSRRGAQPQSAAVSEEPKADIPITDGAGNITGYAFSDRQSKAWDQWNWQQRESALSERLAPLEALKTQIEQAQTMAQIEQVSTQQATQTLTELRQDPYFKEHEPKVKKALIDHPEWGDDVYRAFHHVLRTEIIPNLNRTAEGNVLDKLKTQAAGGTVNPNASAPMQRPKFKDFGEAIRYYDAHPEEAERMAKR